MFDASWAQAIRRHFLGARSYLCDVLGQYEESVAVGEETLRLAREIGDRRMVTSAFINLEQSVAALAGCGVASFTALDFRRDPVEQKLYDLLMLGLREARAPDDLARLMEEGRALSDDEAMRLAFAEQE